MVSVMWGRCGTHGGGEYYVGLVWVLLRWSVGMMWGWGGTHEAGEDDVGQVWDPCRW